MPITPKSTPVTGNAMKQLTLACALILSVFLTGCIKSIADEPDLHDPRFHLQNTGSSAKDLLNDTVFKSLKIEIQYMKGAEPAEETIDNLKSFLKRHLQKPGGIHFSLTEIPSPEDTIYNLQRIMQIEDKYRKSFTRSDGFAVYVLFANGYFYNQKSLGYAYRNSSLVVFGGHIRENAENQKKHSRTYLESRVLQHEFGHLMGLVNFAGETNNEHHDDDHERHCTNKKCLMYYLVDSEDYPLILVKQDPPGLDKHCLDDLKTIAGK
jgi:predicted Zn-dependent protease